MTKFLFAIAALLLSSPGFGAIVSSIDCADASNALQYHEWHDQPGIVPVPGIPHGPYQDAYWTYEGVRLAPGVVSFSGDKVVVSHHDDGMTFYSTYTQSAETKINGATRTVPLTCKSFATRHLPG